MRHLVVHNYFGARDHLLSGNSEEVVSRNIATERAAGKPEKQAVAIAMSKARDIYDEALSKIRDAMDPSSSWSRVISDPNAKSREIAEANIKEFYRLQKMIENASPTDQQKLTDLRALYSRVLEEGRRAHEKRIRKEYSL